jgi:putative membrane protein
VTDTSSNRTQLALLAITALFFVWSGIRPFDRLTWVLEVFPVVFAAPVVLYLYRERLRFTTLVYTLIALHAIILVVGGHYSYAQVPLFNWLKERFQLDRNYYDRLGHFAQGFVPAMIARETLLRKTRLERGAMLTFLVISICSAISAWYEILEFASAKAFGDSAENFLGTQGDVWDTQWDMTICFAGALCSIALMSRWHDHQMRSLDRKPGA